MFLYNIYEKHGLVIFLLVITIIFIPLLISITIHEWSHGFVAYKFGDPTPKNQGRLTLNPLAHLDPLGSLMLLFVGLGWAKPVMIDPGNINTKTKLMLVSLAGPLSNFLLALFVCFILYFLKILIYSFNISIYKDFLAITVIILNRLILINLVLALFNLLPIPPLDGANIIKYILPEKLCSAYEKIAPFGVIILVVILFSAGFGFIFETAKEVSSLLYSNIEFFLDSTLARFGVFVK